MVTKSINGHSFVLYDNAEDLPIKNFHRYSKFLLVEGGIGDSLKDIDSHITRIINFLGDTKKAYQELLNLRKCLYVVSSEQDIRYKSTLCLVKSVDGKEWEDFSDEGLQSLYEMVSGASVRDLEGLVNEVKKRIDENLVLYFPKVFEDSTQKNYADLLRKRAILQLQGIIHKEDNEGAIKELTNEIFSQQKPMNFEGNESEEIKFDKQFEDMCLAMAREFGGGIKNYTTMEFYTAYERLLKEQEAQRKAINRRRK